MNNSVADDGPEKVVDCSIVPAESEACHNFWHYHGLKSVNNAALRFGLYGAFTSNVKSEPAGMFAVEGAGEAIALLPRFPVVTGVEFPMRCQPNQLI